MGTPLTIESFSRDHLISPRVDRICSRVMDILLFGITPPSQLCPSLSLSLFALLAEAAAFLARALRSAGHILRGNHAPILPPLRPVSRKNSISSVIE
jgi:hypothetical protein